MRLLQVTLLAGATPIVTNPTTTGASNPIYASTLIFQDNAAANCRVGDNTVSATRGILITSGSPGGSVGLVIATPRGTHLADYFLFGTAGNVIDILYEVAT